MILQLYLAGAFPMWDETTDEISVFRPDPRAVIELHAFHVPRRLGRRIARRPFRITTNGAFDRVIQECHRHRADGCWCSLDMSLAYEELHEAGHAHSVEAWLDDVLVGGLYGVSIGAAFMAESMFSRPRLGGSDASKVVLVELLRRLRGAGCALFDVQFENDHLRQFGVVAISDIEYRRRLAAAAVEPMAWPSFDVPFAEDANGPPLGGPLEDPIG